MSETLLRWPADMAAICARIAGARADLKIVLKTRNERELIESWILHHLPIAGPQGLVIFDNGSSDPDVLDVYARYGHLVQVFGWDLNHNALHNARLLRPLYDSIRSSCRHYAFLDTDEFAYWTDGRRLDTDSLVARLANDGDGLVYPGMWWRHLPGLTGVYEPQVDLFWGKPLIGAAVDVDGVINHNDQFFRDNPGLRLRGGFVVCHHAMTDPQRRIRVNVDKCVAYRWVANEQEIDAIIASGHFAEFPRKFRRYLHEIVRCRAADRHPVGTVEPHMVTVGIDGRIHFGSPETEHALSRFAAGVDLPGASPPSGPDQSSPHPRHPESVDVMKQESPDSRGMPSARHTCVACPLLCDDILITADAVAGACEHGSAAIRAAMAEDQARDSSRPPAEAWENRGPLGRGEAMERAAAVLVSARRALVTGLANGTLEAITAACDLAERLGAAVDAGLPESARAAGPTIARAGEVTAVWEELRDRADLVIFWGCDPAESHPRFLERFVTPTLSDRRHRRTIAIGPDTVIHGDSTHRHVPFARDRAAEIARWLQMRLAGRHAPPDDSPLSAACLAIEEAIRSADCVAIVTEDAADPVGLEAWSVVHLVRTIAHEKPAFQIPLGAGLAAGGANVAGAATACTWRYGAAGAIARADRAGSLFLPAESDARRLIDRGEVDAVLALGRLSDPFERAIAGRGDALSLVRMCDAAEAMPQTAHRAIQIRCACGTGATTGAMLRGDGRRVMLTPHRQAAVPQMRELLVELTRVVRQSRAGDAAGGTP